MSIEAGTILRETREQQGISIKDASDALHIRLPYLQALENGRAEIIPSVVQARGFLRIYSEYLGLSSEDMIREWDNPGSTPLSQKNKPDQSAGNPAESAPVSSAPQGQMPWAYSDPAAKPAPVHTEPQTIPAYLNQNVPYPTQGTPGSQPVSYYQQQPPVYQQPAAQIPEGPYEQAGDTEETEKPKQKEKKSRGISLFKKKEPKEQAEPVQEEDAQNYFDKIGEQLTTRRKLLALSLEDCESQTLIRSIYLESMENGRFEQLPSLIQGRGMLNNYASFLDLDVNAIMLDFATALQLLSQKRNRRDTDKKHKPTKTAGRLKKFFTPDLFVGVFVIVGIAGIIIYSAITITAYRRSVLEPKPDLGISLYDQYLDFTRTPDFLPTVSPTAVLPFIQNPYREIEEEEPTETPERAVSSQPVQLFVTANQRALMTVISDGKEVFSGRTMPNNTYPFDAENLIELKVSNADAVSVVYNQQNLGRLGKLGEVITIDFSPYLAATPTPQFSPTPTATYEPTYTPQPETPLPTNTPTPYIP